MSEQQQLPDQTSSDKSHQPPRSFAAVLPYIATVITAVLLSLLIQFIFWPQQSATIVVVATPTPIGDSATPEATSAPRPTTQPTATLPPVDEGVLRLEIIDLEETDRQHWTALYLLRAALQIDDAVTALQSNDLAEVDRILLTARRSLDRAYESSAEQEKGPIDTFRLQISQIRDDLHLRPEGADRRLRQTRQLILSLVDEGA